MTTENNTQAAIDAGQAIASAQQFMKLHGDVPYVIKADGTPVIIDALLKINEARAEKPRELAGQAKLITEAALIAHMQRFRDSDSVLFYDGARLLAVYDYHRPMASPPDGQPCMVRNEKARWGRHTALYVPQLSPEWKAWVQGAGKLLSQVDFADFLDEHACDVAMPSETRPDVPTVADLATMALTLKVTSEDVIESAINRTTGEYSLVAKQEQKTTGQTKIPKEFDIVIPIYEGGQRYRITCAIRFRKQDSRALFAWVVRGTDKLLREAFADIAERVSKETGVPALAGSPEGSS